jgi:hypothetical protein
MTLANYLQQRQQTLNKQTSLNSQGSSELDIQPSPRVSRHASRTETEITSSLRLSLPSTYQQTGSSTGKRYSAGHYTSVVETYQHSTRHVSFENSSRDFLLQLRKD